MKRTSTEAGWSLDVPPGSAPLNTRYIYYPTRTGYIFTCTKMITALRLPFHGIVAITADGNCLDMSLGRRSLRQSALAVCPRGLSIRACRTRLVCIVVNPLHPCFRAFRLLQPPYFVALDRKHFRDFDSTLRAAVDGTLNHEDSLRLFDGVLERTQAHLPIPRDRDPRAQQLIELLWAHPKYSISEMAEHLKLSYGRTSHLFAHTVGISVRTYQLWQKIYRASAALIAGATVTEAAHAAGFSDTAHFSSAYQRAYGCAPSFIFRNARVNIACEHAVFGDERRTDGVSSKERHFIAQTSLSQTVQATRDEL